MRKIFLRKYILMARRWCFTLNNYSEEDITALEQWAAKRFLIIGREVGESGTPHLQGYVELQHPLKLTTLKNVSPKAHWERAAGDQKSNIAYCSKDGNVSTYGEPGEQGKRNDLKEIKETAVERGMRGVLETATCYNSIRIAEKYLVYFERKRDWQPEVYWFWGPTGTGKSRLANEEAGPNAYRKNDDTKWWDGYDAHENVIIDDFRDSWWKITEMLSLLDRYSKTIECKGGSRQFLARKIWVTSAREPSTMYQGTGESITQLLRRINIIKYLSPATEVLTTEVGGNTSPPLFEYDEDWYVDDEEDEGESREDKIGLDCKYI